MKFDDFLFIFGEFYRGVENFSIFHVFYFNFVFASESYHFDDRKSDRRANFRVISKQNQENHKSENIVLPLISVKKITSGDKKSLFRFFFVKFDDLPLIIQLLEHFQWSLAKTYSKSCSVLLLWGVAPNFSI